LQLQAPAGTKPGKLQSIHREFLPRHPYQQGHSIVYSYEELRKREEGKCEFHIFQKKALFVSRRLVTDFL